MMLFSNLNVETKTLRIISLILTLIGIIFIIFSNYVGNFAIRLSMAIVFVMSLLNFKNTFNYSSFKERLNMTLALVGSFLVFIIPSLAMLIIGVAILVITIPFIFKSIKNKDYSDKIMLALSIIGTIFSIYCIINTSAALKTVISIIGIAFVILGCLMFYEILNINRNKYPTYKQENHNNKHGFENPKDSEFYK